MEIDAGCSAVESETPSVGWTPLNSQSSDGDIDAQVRNFSWLINHPAGTAAMGKVIDSKLRVHSVQGLRVMDASIFPSPVAATTQATVYAIAEAAAELIIKGD